MHVMKAAGGFYLRVRIPTYLRKKVGKSEFRRKLNATSALDARRQSAALYAKLVGGFESVRSMSENYSDSAYIAKLEECLRESSDLREVENEAARLQAKLDKLNDANALCESAKHNRENTQKFGQAVEGLETKSLNLK